ncbi:ethylene-responsive transcription factor ERF017-like [Olea europaea var. sylvestris]|uniref:ethylene-responsive transcription factor ERF017-like n=1 Tax=Olea europaea var. sylvestris TaxID=158386 RepID=UPI000C1D0D5E|nr:ethylene-responsive transcription factor ERF017-like [Olea europaea var. sylvestris]
MDKTAPSSSSSPSVEQAGEPMKYKGVRKRKWGKYVSEIRLPNSRERIWLGSYDTAEKAARAFDAALFCLRGPQSKFNFPDDPPNIEGGSSLSPEEIKDVANQYATGHSGNNTQQPESSDPRTGSEDYMNPSFWDMPDSNETGPWMNLESEFGLFPDTVDYMQLHFTDENNDNDIEEDISQLWNFDQR